MGWLHTNGNRSRCLVGVSPCKPKAAMVQVGRTYFLGCHYIGDRLSHLVALVLGSRKLVKYPGLTGYGLPPERELSMTLFYSTYLWSVGVMEYWKNENPTTIFCNFKKRTSIISDAENSLAIDYHSSAPTRHHSLKLPQAEPIISDLAQNTRISKFDHILNIGLRLSNRRPYSR